MAPVLFNFMAQSPEPRRRQDVASRMTKHRRFGSAPARISVSINRPASSAYRRPVRNLGSDGS
jgi:hypothetical protein